MSPASLVFWATMAGLSMACSIISKVAAGGEGFAGSSDDGDADLGVGGDVEPDAAELVVQLEVGGVEGFRTVHREGDDAVGFFDEEVLV